MKPVEFFQQTAVLAKDQPEYQPLPVWQDDDHTLSCWTFTFWERVRILFGNPLWLLQMNFGRPLQPQLPTLDCPLAQEIAVDAQPAKNIVH